MLPELCLFGDERARSVRGLQSGNSETRTGCEHESPERLLYSRKQAQSVQLGADDRTAAGSENTKSDARLARGLWMGWLRVCGRRRRRCCTVDQSRPSARERDCGEVLMEQLTGGAFWKILFSSKVSPCLKADPLSLRPYDERFSWKRATGARCRRASRQPLSSSHTLFRGAKRGVMSSAT